MSDPRLLDIAERYVGSDIALFQSHYICKEPRVGQVVLWHQVRLRFPMACSIVSAAAMWSNAEFATASKRLFSAATKRWAHRVYPVLRAPAHR